MSTVKPLPASRLHATFNPERIPWDDSSAIPLPRPGRDNPFQPRAMQALNLALQIREKGYNVYLSGTKELGRSSMLLNYLRPRAQKESTPPDLLYVHNFSDPDCPRLLSLPAGQGKKLRTALKKLVEDIREELPRRFEAKPYIKRRAKLMDKLQNTRMGLLSKMNSVATDKGFNLDMDDSGGLTLYPLVEGKRLNEEEFDSLDNAVRFGLKKRGDSLVRDMAGFMRQLSRAEESFQNGERDLDRETMSQVLDSLLTPMAQQFSRACRVPSLTEYFTDLREDILKHTEVFLQKDAFSGPPGDGHANVPAEAALYRYSANLLVDNADLRGAPIVVEDHPTVANLLGCIERESEMGALITDFTLVRSGSIHKANGGFLVLHVDDLLQHPSAWEGLLRALRANQIRIEDTGDTADAAMRTKSITPAPLPLNLKVVLIGTEDVYENLLEIDDRFHDFFRIKAHMTDVAERTATNIRFYLAQLAEIIRDAALPPFDKSALAWLVGMGSYLSEDQRRLSLRFPRLREIMVEASTLARMRREATVSAPLLEEAHTARTFRANLVEERFMEEYDRKMIKVCTSGVATGQVNGLSVTWHGDFEFGLPHRISCTVGVGHDGIIDLEREAELGGPIHTKAMMILKSFLTDLFARTKPLVLSGSLYFEQSYAGIEGDSASGAELVAFLSALADVPVRLDLAFTGAVSHSGEILPVGGVTQKIQGFYKVCAKQGLTGSQGVIIPHDNADQLLLASDVIHAVEEKQFFVYPVRRIEEALLLLTGIPPGRRRKNGGFTKGSLYDLVDKRFEQLGRCAQNAFRHARKP